MSAICEAVVRHAIATPVSWRRENSGRLTLRPRQHGRMAKSGRNVLTDNGTELAADSQQATDLTLSSYYAYGRSIGESGEQPDQGVENATWLKFLFEQGMIEGYAELDASNADEVLQADCVT